MSHSESNKRILKNTLALYFRQIITMAVSLFTSRVILQTLGVTDYGINNVVGGVVSMLSFLTSSLSGTTQRFINVEIGKNNSDELKKIFSNSLFLYVIFIFLVTVLAETVGLWFVKNKLVIPPERMDAAFWVYQFSVIAFCVSVFFAPFEGAIKAHEKFSFYAKMSIFDVVARLAVVYLLYILPFDKLLALSFAHLGVVIIGKIIVYSYCHRKFDECRIKISWTKECIQRLMGFNFYKIIDSVSYLIRFQGLNVVLNLYYGPVLNAAQGIANTVYHALSSFANNAATATQPQIIVSYTQSNEQRLWSLITKSSRLYFYLLLVLILPVMLEINTALFIWLGDYPEYAPVFAQLFLLEALQRVLSYPLAHANAAVGKLRAMTIKSILCRVFILLSAIYVGANKLSPTYIYISALVFQGIDILLSVIIVIKIQLGFSIRKYVSSVIIPILKTGFLAAFFPMMLHYFFSKSILSSCLIGFAALFWSMIIIFFVGLNKREKQMIIKRLPLFLKAKIQKEQ
jgi:O-antigen/teichoic acid export membrane protein